MPLYHKPIDLGDLTELREVALILFAEQTEPSLKFKYYTFATPENKLILEEILIPKLKKVMRHPLDMYRIVWGHVPPMSNLGIHIDTPPSGHVTSTPNLNIPLKNCKGGITRWWNGKYKLIERGPEYANKGSGRTVIEWEDGPYVDEEYRLNEPIWMNANVPHSAENVTTNPRILLSLKFSAEFTIEDA